VDAGALFALHDGREIWTYSLSERFLSSEVASARGELGLSSVLKLDNLEPLSPTSLEEQILRAKGALRGAAAIYPGVPLGWGTDKWAVECSTTWHDRENWGLACGAGAPRAPRVAKNTTFALLLERLCLRTEAVAAEAADISELAPLSEDLTAGEPFIGSDGFRGGVVCMWRQGTARGLCVARACVEDWMREPASGLVCCGKRLAYVDKGGHLVRVDLLASKAASCRVANPTLHRAQLALCANRAGCELLVSCHSNLIGSAWRPQSAPGFALLVNGAWTLAPPGVPYMLCCTWSGEVLWSAVLPARARCCSAAGGSLFVGTLEGTLRVDVERGVLLEHFGHLRAVEMAARDAGAACVLAAMSDAGDIRVLELPRE
jgi:hypothetical protein